MMIAASIAPHFWAEAVSTTASLINIQPSSALKGGIPLELLWDCSPNYSELRSLGCVCYVFLVDGERTKLIAKSVDCLPWQ